MSVIEQTQIVPAGRYAADKAHSSVSFGVRHLKIVTVRGEFLDYDAELQGGDQPSLSGAIRTAAVTTHDETRDQHLRSPEFFDTDRYPQATLVATAIEPGKVVADLTLRGVTRPVELEAVFSEPAIDPWGNTRVGVELNGSLDRRDFGIVWNAPLPGGGALLDDEVKLSASLSFIKEA
jgi:polyisoprenoid-binding protein YceI